MLQQLTRNKQDKPCNKSMKFHPTLQKSFQKDPFDTIEEPYRVQQFLVGQKCSLSITPMIEGSIKKYKWFLYGDKNTFFWV